MLLPYNADVIEDETELLASLGELLAHFVGDLLSLRDELPGIEPRLANTR